MFFFFLSEWTTSSNATSMSKQCLIHFGKILLTKQINFFGGGRGWSFFFVTFGVCHFFSVQTQGFEWRRLRTEWKHHLHNRHWPKIPYSLISGTVFSTAAPAQLSRCQCSLASQTNHRQRNSSAELIKWKLGITRLSCTFSPTKHSTHHMTNCNRLAHLRRSWDQQPDLFFSPHIEDLTNKQWFVKDEPMKPHLWDPKKRGA